MQCSGTNSGDLDKNSLKKHSRESLKHCFGDIISSSSQQRDYVELKNFWNCFLLLDDKESYGLVLLDGGFIDFTAAQIQTSSCPPEDFMHVLENALVCDKFRLSCLRNLNLIRALCISFDVCLKDDNICLLSHVVIVLRNLFYEVPPVDVGDWMAYQTAHSVIKSARIPEGLVRIISELDDVRLRFFAFELAAFDFVDLDKDCVFGSLEAMCKFIVDYLIKAIKNPAFTLTLPGTEYSSTAFNTCSMLSKIMYSDELKQLCFSEELVESLLSFLEHPMAPKNCSEVLTILDHLCFIESKEIGSAIIYGNKDLFELVQYLSAQSEKLPSRFSWVDQVSKSAEVVSAAKSLNRGLLAVKEFQESQKIAASTCVELGNGKPGFRKGSGGASYIMLSYNWEAKEPVRVLVQKLRKAGYEVWLDDDEMAKYGDINDAMSDAVEKCELMVAVISEKYKSSINCRRELEYADNRRKPFMFVKKDQSFDPNGWLGLMMGKSLYYTLDERNIDESCEYVISGIRCKLHGSEFSLDEPASVKSATTGSAATSGTKKAVVMSHEEYKDWVKNNPSIKFLRSWKNKKVFNENVIAALVDQMNDRSTKDFLDYLQSNFSVNASEALTLQKILENYTA